MIRGQSATRAAPGALDRTQVAEIAQQELARGAQDQAAAAAQAQAEGRLAAVEANVAKLAETRPRQPTRRITKLFWPGHDKD